MEYHNETVLATIDGRIHPFDDKSIPDAICSIVITEKMLYVAEDNYDGTYTDHYTISMDKVENIAVERPFEKSTGQTGPRYAGYQDRPLNLNYGLPLHGFVDAIFDKFDPFLADKPGNEKAKYLVIHYIDKNEKNSVIYINECNRSAKKFVKEWNSLKLLH